MLQLIAENQNGDRLDLTGNHVYRTTVTGLNPPNATINTSTVGLSDGSIFNSSRVENRNIVLTIKIVNDVEASRISLYRIFTVKQPIRLYVKNDARDVFIDGRVENFELNHHENPQSAQISILCPTPYFQGMREDVIESSVTESLFEFPFSIEEEGIPLGEIKALDFITMLNEGDVANGMTVEFVARGEVVNPRIYSVKTHGKIGLQKTMNEGESIVVTTVNMKKSVYLMSNAEKINFIKHLDRNPEWFQLSQGENYYTLDADQGIENLNIRFKHRNEYEGV